MEETCVALLAGAVEKYDFVEKRNGLLHECGSYMIGRMGLPYPKRQISQISVMLDAPGDVLSARSGKVGRLKGSASKVVCSKVRQ